MSALGPTALERALVAHLEPGLLGMLLYGQLRIPGLVSWAVAAHVDEKILPNQYLWAHLDDIASMPEQLRAALGS